MISVVSLDWLSITCETLSGFPFRPELREADFFVTENGYRVDYDGTGTKMWSYVGKVYDPDNILLGTLAWQPRQTKLQQSLAQLKIDNQVLYEAEYWQRTVDAMLSLGLRFRNINRLDVACDFNEFSGGLLPRNFIDRLVAGEFVKVGLTGAYAFLDFGTTVVEKNGLPDYILGTSIGEAERDFITRAYGRMRKLKALPPLPLDYTDPRDALSNIVPALAGDAVKDTDLAARYLNTLGIGRQEALPLLRRLWVGHCNARAALGGLPAQDYEEPVRLHERKPARVDSLTFGRAGKAVQVILYNKTKELREVSMKTYIVDTWRRAGLDISRDVWRVEIRLRGEGLELVNGEGEQLKLSLPDLDIGEKLNEIFAAYAEKYFKFYRADGIHSKIQNCPRLRLFEFSCNPVIRPKRHKKRKNPTLYTRNIISALKDALRDCRRDKAPASAYYLEKVIDYYKGQYILGQYIEKVADKYAEHPSDLPPFTPSERCARMFSQDFALHQHAFASLTALGEKIRATAKKLIGDRMAEPTFEVDWKLLEANAGGSQTQGDIVAILDSIFHIKRC